MATAMAESIAELQKAADSIREGLKVVNEDIKKLTGRDPAEYRTPANRRIQLKRNFNQQRDIGGPLSKRLSQDGSGRRWGRTVVASRIRPDEMPDEVDSSGDEEVVPQKPAVQSSVVATVKTPNLEAKPRVVDKTTQLRNKRMFGLLLGTLKQFKDDDKQRSEKEKRREAIEKKLDEQAQKERAELATQRKELFQSRRQKQQELRKLEHKMEIAELKTEVEAHNQLLKKFIKLKASPSLYYLPKIHNEKTEELLKKSAEDMDVMQKQRFNEMDLSDDDAEAETEEKGKLPSSVVLTVSGITPNNEESKEPDSDEQVDRDNLKEHDESSMVVNCDQSSNSESLAQQLTHDEKVSDEFSLNTSAQGESTVLHEQSASDQAEAHEVIEQLG